MVLVWHNHYRHWMTSSSNLRTEGILFVYTLPKSKAAVHVAVSVMWWPAYIAIIMYAIQHLVTTIKCMWFIPNILPSLLAKCSHSIVHPQSFWPDYHSQPSSVTRQPCSRLRHHSLRSDWSLHLDNPQHYNDMLSQFEGPLYL